MDYPQPDGFETTVENSTVLIYKSEDGAEKMNIDKETGYLVHIHLEDGVLGEVTGEDEINAYLQNI